MSEPDKDISKVCGSAAADDDEDEDDDADAVDQRDGDGVVRDDGREIHRRTSYGYGLRRNVAKAKKVVLLPFTNANKYLNRSRKTNTRQSCFSSQHQSNSGEKHGSSRVGVVDACFCFTRPRTLESSVDPQTLDPNDCNFTYDMLKALIEKNDFYSKKCNPHVDFVGPSSCNDANG